MLNDINQECSDLCSRKNPSCLRSPNKENILKFSMEHFNKELKEWAPLTFSVLVAASVNPQSRSRANKNGLNIETFWSPAVGMAAAVCLRNRSRFMNALQLLITIFNYHSGWQVCISIFIFNTIHIILEYFGVITNISVMCIESNKVFIIIIINYYYYLAQFAWVGGGGGLDPWGLKFRVFSFP